MSTASGAGRVARVAIAGARVTIPCRSTCALHTLGLCLDRHEHTQRQPTSAGTGLHLAWRAEAPAIIIASVPPERVDAQHDSPAWRERSNFIIGARLPEETRSEQLWARKVGEALFEICCIPFFLYDVALGDVVRTNEAFDIEAVVERSGRSVFRVWFGDAAHPQQDKVVADLSRLGCLVERSSTNLIAVDASDDECVQRASDYLSAAEARRDMTFEAAQS